MHPWPRSCEVSARIAPSGSLVQLRAVIYLDTSVALAHLLAEDRRPPDSLWERSLVSSRLLEYETWNRVNTLGLSASHGPLVQDLVERLGLVELRHEALARAREPFPVAMRTLDAMHLSTALYLKNRGFTVALATYDERLRDAAIAVELELAAVD